MSTASARRRGRVRRLAVRGRPGPRLLAGLLGGLIVLGGAYLWLRDSSLVAVQNVKIVGTSGPDARQIRAALHAAARTMTTLDVKMRALQTAVSPYPVVKSLDVSTQFPNAMTVRVSEQVPVAVVAAGGRRIPVAGDGTLLHDLKATAPLPVISMGVVPGGTRLTGWALSEARLLGAAPYPFLARLSGVSDGSAHGLVGQLRNGPSLYFGGVTELSAKWAAVTEVLASSTSAGAQYIDVTDPHRPAAGAGADSVGSSSTAGTSGSAPPVGTGTSAVAPASTAAGTATTTNPSGG
ncbi:MAG: cell division protein FtsQ [Solirubrobacteraceae bacterium]|nr:cell division protein FtsQ [Solirubrobacteraceae bacterium]